MTNQIRYIDLFAGCGGISLGLHNAGMKGLFAIERNPDAFDTLKHNLIDKLNHFEWPDWLTQKYWNINHLLHRKHAQLSALNGAVDLVVGGPPCQGFSLVGERLASDRRNKLINSYLRFIDVVRPKLIVFENVQGFTVRFTNSKHHKQVPYSEILLKKLHELGYTDARGEMIDFSEYGVPQRRRRFVVIASLSGYSDRIFHELKNGRNDFLLSKGIVSPNTTESALSDLEKKHGTVNCPDTKRFLSGVIAPPQNNLQRYFQISEQTGYIPDSHRFVNHTLETEKIFELLLATAPRNKRIFGDERHAYGIKKRNVTVLAPDLPSLTITTIPDDFIHYSEPRVMTVRECARLQTFPDWYEFKGPYTTGGTRRVRQTPRYTQVGNAVPPMFAEQLGIAIQKVLDK